MKEYKILKYEECFQDGEKFHISNKLLDDVVKFSLEAFNALIVMIHLKCNNEKVNIKNVSDRIGKTRKTTKKYIDELIEKKCIAEM